MLSGGLGLSLHSRSEPLSAAPLPLTACLPESGCSRRDSHSITASATTTIPRSTCSSEARNSTRERIHDDVHAKARVVDRREPLAVRMVVPLRAVVLATVENPDAISLHHRLKVLVHQVVTPAIELVTGCRRAVA